MSKKYFDYDESPISPNRFLIRPNFEELPLNATIGSYGVLPARVMNMSYVTYLRMCRDLFGAEITGKNTLYPKALFEDGKKVKELVAMLNNRTERILEKEKEKNTWHL